MLYILTGKVNGLQCCIRNYSPHAIYINCRNHWLALSFKHLRNDFLWLGTIDSILLGLWKAFHFNSENRFLFNETQEAYGLKTLPIIKATITRWLSHGVACKRCCEHYCIIQESLDDFITSDPKAELNTWIGICDQLLQQDTIMQTCFLEDVLSVTNFCHWFYSQAMKILVPWEDLLNTPSVSWSKYKRM